jgi:putative GTP pyrophosphokinase
MTDLKSDYARRRETILEPLANMLAAMLSGYLEGTSRIDRISVRAKSVERFLAKAARVEGSASKYDDPLSQVQDQIGARIITFYLSDVQVVADVVTKYLRPIEEKLIIPDSESEFGYVGKHFILLIPTDVFDATITREKAPQFFELQIKTLFQHAWSEAEHDLGYKPTASLTSHQKRRIAFTAAQAWGADLFFDELHSETTNSRGDSSAA